MKALSSLLLTGLAHGEDLKAPPVFVKHAGNKKIVKRLIAAVFVAAAAYAAGQPLTLESAWLDQSVSEHFSQKYGCPVRFKNVSVSLHSGIRFGSLAVRSRENRLLISATSGTVRLKKWGVRKDLVLEAEMHLENVAFEKEFYKNSPYFNKTFGHFMHKPLIVYDLTVSVHQDERFTLIKIMRCDSKDVKVNGHLLLDNSRVVQDKLLVTFSPFMMVRAILPKDRADGPLVIR